MINLSLSEYIFEMLNLSSNLQVTNVPRCEELLEELMDSYIKAPEKRRSKYLNDPDCKIELNFQV